MEVKMRFRSQSMTLVRVYLILRDLKRVYVIRVMKTSYSSKQEENRKPHTKLHEPKMGQ